MGRYISLRAGLVALVTALALGPASTLGDPPVQFHARFTQSFDFGLCGIPIEGTAVVTGDLFLYADDSAKDTSSVQVTYTNPVNGKFVIVSNAGMISGLTIIDPEADAITFVESFVGLPQKVQTDRGAFLLRDAGVITFAPTFDLATGEFISSQTIIEGPDPDAKADFTLFCAVITAALT